TRRVHRQGPKLGDVHVQKVDSVGAHFGAAQSRVLGDGGVASDRWICQYATEVSYRAYRCLERLLLDQLAHVGPCIERLDETGDVDLRLTPTELAHLGAHPNLKGLG